jgi:hypothetical protein
MRRRDRLDTRQLTGRTQILILAASFNDCSAGVNADKRRGRLPASKGVHEAARRAVVSRHRARSRERMFPEERTRHRTQSSKSSRIVAHAQDGRVEERAHGLLHRQWGESAPRMACRRAVERRAYLTFRDAHRWGLGWRGVSVTGRCPPPVRPSPFNYYFINLQADTGSV